MTTLNSQSKISISHQQNCPSFDFFEVPKINGKICFGGAVFGLYKLGIFIGLLKF
jgi:hypothetical protein